jgi:mono/diheme cytochrome c family protein
MRWIVSSALILSILLLGVVSRVEAQAANAAAEERIVKRGASVFAATCTGYCHGPNGTAGSSAPALASRGFDGEYILKTVMYGVPGTAMIAWGQRIPKDDSAAVIEYVKSLNGIVSGGAPKPPAPFSPVAQHGHDAFFDSYGQLMGCSNCHQLSGAGIAVTPPIGNIPADVAALRSLATPHVVEATVAGRTFPALVVSQVRDETKLYDMTTIPPVLMGRAPKEVKLGAPASWRHSSVLSSYSEDDLSAILEYLRASTAPQ